MCYPRADFRVGEHDVLPGDLGPDGTPFCMNGAQYLYWKHTHLTVDVVPGRRSGFTVEAPEGVRFLIRSRLLADEEEQVLADQGPPSTGPDPRPTPRPAASLLATSRSTDPQTQEVSR
jgi:hypothetical protein